jgi:hypothetical protein
MTMPSKVAKTPRKAHHGSTLDSFLNEEGILAECEAIAIKEVIAWQIEKAMADKKLSKNKMAATDADQSRPARSAARSARRECHVGDAATGGKRARQDAAARVGLRDAAISKKIRHGRGGGHPRQISANSRSGAITEVSK